MKTLGLLGGMSWESTVEYYRLVNQQTRDRLGGLHSAPLLLWSADFHEIEQLQAAGAWEEAASVLAEAAVALEGAGAEVLVLCTNTMHKVADQLEAAVTIPFVHIVDSVAAPVLARGMRRVGLLGTRFTMEEAFWADRMSRHGVDLLVPGKQERDELHRIIYEELCVGICSETSRGYFLKVIEGLAGAGAEGVVLGCTEIELLVQQQHTPVVLFPSTALHVRSAVDAALQEPG
ncbi:MAG TPA: aspartate/glutamate racemase family protein [Actinomycetota bacterium]|nr:aspartate/glutamate racemase family protein [Actinomycetota bacterium]